MPPPRRSLAKCEALSHCLQNSSDTSVFTREYCSLLLDDLFLTPVEPCLDGSDDPAATARASFHQCVHHHFSLAPASLYPNGSSSDDGEGPPNFAHLLGMEVAQAPVAVLEPTWQKVVKRQRKRQMRRRKRQMRRRGGRDCG